MSSAGNKKKGTPSKIPPSTAPILPSKGPSPSASKKKTKKARASSPIRVLAKLLIIAFLTYSIFWVACTPDIEADKFCPLPTPLRLKVTEEFSKIGTRLEPLQVLVQEKIYKPFVLPAYTQLRLALDPQLEKVSQVYQDFSKTEQGQKFEILVFGSLARAKETWHKVSVAFVEDILPKIAKWLASGTEKVSEKLPVVRQKVAKGAKKIRSHFNKYSPKVTEPMVSAYKTLCKNADQFYKDILATPTVKSLGEQPVLKQVFSQYQTLFQPSVERAWSATKSGAHKLFVTFPSASLDFVWRLLENDVSSEEWSGLFGSSSNDKKTKKN